MFTIQEWIGIFVLLLGGFIPGLLVGASFKEIIFEDED